MIYCNHCGAKNDDDAVFCESCGSRISDSAQMPAQQMYTQQPSYQQMYAQQPSAQQMYTQQPSAQQMYTQQPSAQQMPEHLTQTQETPVHPQGNLLYYGKGRFGPYIAGIIIGIFLTIMGLVMLACVFMGFTMAVCIGMIVGAGIFGGIGLFLLFTCIRLAAIGCGMYICIYEDHIEGNCWCEKHGEDFNFALGDIVSVEHPASTALVSFMARGRVYSIVFNSQEESEMVHNILINTCSRR